MDRRGGTFLNRVVDKIGNIYLILNQLRVLTHPLKGCLPDAGSHYPFIVDLGNKRPLLQLTTQPSASLCYSIENQVHGNAEVCRRTERPRL